MIDRWYSRRSRLGERNNVIGCREQRERAKKGIGAIKEIFVCIRSATGHQKPRSSSEFDVGSSEIGQQETSGS